jgi:hypothetical protein
VIKCRGNCFKGRRRITLLCDNKDKRMELGSKLKQNLKYLLSILDLLNELARN